jgi:hypothetical protein
LRIASQITQDSIPTAEVIECCMRWKMIMKIKNGFERAVILDIFLERMGRIMKNL